MKPLCNRVTIIGVGLIGGSLGMALKRHHVASEVVGVSRRRATLGAAKRRRAIDRGTTSVVEGVRGADIVVIATPPGRMVAVAKQIRPHLEPGTIVTDVGSTKQQLVRELQSTLRGTALFVGGHPMAGSECKGIAAASVQLFDGRLCILTPTASTTARALRRVRQLWQHVGARVVQMTPVAHDRWAAIFSHLPHMVAMALMHASDQQTLPRTPQSFLDMTRIAQSDPAMWVDIVQTNPQAITAGLRRMEREIATMRRTIQSSKRTTLRRYFTRAQQRRIRLS